MTRYFSCPELIKSIRKWKQSQKSLIMRYYHLSPGEENLCVVSKSYNDLEMEVRTVALPKENEVLIRVGCCCLSTFDFHYLTRYYGKDKGLYNTVVLGGFATGIVVKLGASVKEEFSEGDRVALEPGIFCNKCKNCLAGRTNLCPSISYLGSQGRDGALCRFINHPIAFTHKLDPNVSLEAGSLATKIAGCVHCYKRAGITKNSKVLILGTSLLGLVSIMVIKNLGVKSVFVTETNNYRLRLARNLGADYVIKMTSMHSPEYPEYLKEIMDSIHSGEPDLVIDTIGSASSLESAFHLSKSGGRILLMNMMTSPIPTRFLHATLREIDIIGGYSYNHESFKEAIHLLSTQQDQFKKILPVKIPLERALDAFSHGRATGGENMFIIVNSYNENEEKSKTVLPSSTSTKTAGIPQLKPVPETKPTSIKKMEKIIEQKQEDQETLLSIKISPSENEKKSQKITDINKKTEVPDNLQSYEKQAEKKNTEHKNMKEESVRAYKDKPTDHENQHDEVASERKAPELNKTQEEIKDSMEGQLKFTKGITEEQPSDGKEIKDNLDKKSTQNIGHRTYKTGEGKEERKAHSPKTEENTSSTKLPVSENMKIDNNNNNIKKTHDNEEVTFTSEKDNETKFNIYIELKKENKMSDTKETLQSGVRKETKKTTDSSKNEENKTDNNKKKS